MRLSSLDGDKLTKGNPAITDLGDPNRPMKLAEKYGELYDNEWTDALDSTEEMKALYRIRRSKCRGSLHSFCVIWEVNVERIIKIE